MQQSDSRGEGQLRAQLGVLEAEPVVAVGLHHGAQQEPVRRADVFGRDRVQAGPFTHRPLEHPVLGADQRARQGQQALPGWQLVELGQRLAVAFEEFVPGFDERGPVVVDVLEVPVEAAAGDAGLLAEAFDFECAHTLFGEHGVAHLEPVLGRQAGRRLLAHHHTVEITGRPIGR